MSKKTILLIVGGVILQVLLLAGVYVVASQKDKDCTGTGQTAEDVEN